MVRYSYGKLKKFLKEQEDFSATAYWAPEGKMTVGYGHQLNGGDYGKVTKRSASKLLMFDVLQAEAKAESEVNDKYGDSTFNFLPWIRRLALIEMVFNMGTLASFPKFTNAVVNEDKEGMLKEYKRYYRNPVGEWVEMKRRNNAFRETFLNE